jgi:hypothetical protein
MEITRVKEPKFKVGRYSLNLAELWQLRLEVAKGLKPSGIIVTDYEGRKAYILDRGDLSDNLKGMDTSINIKFELINYNKRVV